MRAALIVLLGVCAEGRRTTRRNIAKGFPIHSLVGRVDVSHANGSAFSGGGGLSMPGALRIAFDFNGVGHTLLLDKAPVIASGRYRSVHLDGLTEGDLTGADRTRPLAGRIREAGGAGPESDSPRALGSTYGGEKRRRRSAAEDLDCFYHGTVEGTVGSTVAVSGCKLPSEVHAAVFMPGNGSFELVPTENAGEHAAYTLVGQPAGSVSEGSCGTRDLDPGDTSPEHALQDLHAGDGGGGGNEVVAHVRRSRGRRQSCSKTVEVLILNDEALYDRFDDDTEVYAVQIFNAMAGFYASAGFDCAITLSLIGQLTFRHGVPATIAQPSCSETWYHASLPTAADNECCAASNACGCAAGTDMLCLERDSGCAAAPPSVRDLGCHSYGSRWSTCGSRRRVTLHQYNASDGSCAAASTLSHETDCSVMLEGLKTWVGDHLGELESIFSGSFDNVLLFSGKDFTSGTAGLAYVGSMCGAVPASSVNMIRPVSAMRNAIVASHEMGHNLGLYHQHTDNAAMMYPSTGSGSDGHWAAASITRMNQLVTPRTLSCIDGPDAARDGEDRRWTVCGDGVVEGTEQCDPGFGADDTCCTLSCQLEAGCACANTDGCCAAGVIMPAGAICRSASHADCDTDEACDGAAPGCPHDVFEPAGASCGSDGEGGLCYEGGCHTELGDGDCPADTPSFCAGQRAACEVWCTPGDGLCYTDRVYAPDGTPCGSGMQCSAGNFMDYGERCVDSAVLGLQAPTQAPTAIPTVALGPPTTVVPAMPPTTASPATKAPTGSPAVAIPCTDAAYTSFTVGGSTNAECPALAAYCSNPTHGTVVSRLCPVTCGACPDTCSDFDGGTGYRDAESGVAILCPDVGVYGISCSTAGMPQRCPLSCGICTTPPPTLPPTLPPTFPPTDGVCVATGGCRHGNRPL